MSRRQIEAIATQLAEAIAAEQGVELVDVEYVKEYGRYVLRVTIDKPGGVDLNDCQRLSEVLSDRLDEVDPIPGPYSLEVSSPGVERPLKKRSDYERFAGRQAQLKTFAPIDGRKNWKGVIVAATEEAVVLEVDGTQVSLPFSMIARAQLIPEF